MSTFGPKGSEPLVKVLSSITFPAPWPRDRVESPVGCDGGGALICADLPICHMSAFRDAQHFKPATELLSSGRAGPKVNVGGFRRLSPYDCGHRPRIIFQHRDRIMHARESIWRQSSCQRLGTVILRYQSFLPILRNFTMTYAQSSLRKAVAQEPELL